MRVFCRPRPRRLWYSTPDRLTCALRIFDKGAQPPAVIAAHTVHAYAWNRWGITCTLRSKTSRDRWSAIHRTSERDLTRLNRPTMSHIVERLIPLQLKVKPRLAIHLRPVDKIVFYLIKKKKEPDNQASPVCFYILFRWTRYFEKHFKSDWQIDVPWEKNIWTFICGI